MLVTTEFTTLKLYVNGVVPPPASAVSVSHCPASAMALLTSRTGDKAGFTVICVVMLFSVTGVLALSVTKMQ